MEIFIQCGVMTVDQPSARSIPPRTRDQDRAAEGSTKGEYYSEEGVLW